MILKLLFIGLFFIQFVNAVDDKIKCYECSRGTKEKQDKLIELFSSQGDESIQRALNNTNEDCGSGGTLDAGFVTECVNKQCQIAYYLHDKNFTVISNCQSKGDDGASVSGKYAIKKCVEDLCNNKADGQDDKEDNGSGVSTQINFLILITFLIPFLIRFA